MNKEDRLKCNKVRAKGWHYQLQVLKQSVENLIMMTPTSELRNKITELQFEIMKIEEFDKEQKEVL